MNSKTSDTITLGSREMICPGATCTPTCPAGDSCITTSAPVYFAEPGPAPRPPTHMDYGLVAIVIVAIIVLGWIITTTVSYWPLNGEGEQ